MWCYEPPARENHPHRPQRARWAATAATGWATLDFDTQRGEICPMAMHVAFLYIDILRYGGSIPGQNPGEAIFSCPDADTLNIFKVEVVQGESLLP